MASDFGSRVANFLCNYSLGFDLPGGIEVLKPYDRQEVRRVVHTFCEQYYGGNHPRLGIWGINPGRFGAGITGICFTDPFALTTQLGINSSLTGKRELSAEFISMVIEAYGGPAKFYHDVYLGALSPLGFVAGGKNVNFYDNKKLALDILPLIEQGVRTITSFGLLDTAAILLGKGTLHRYVNKHLPWFSMGRTMVALDHPRFIMQYKRSKVEEYVRQYVEVIAVYSHPY